MQGEAAAAVGGSLTTAPPTPRPGSHGESISPSAADRRRRRGAGAERAMWGPRANLDG